MIVVDTNIISYLHFSTPFTEQAEQLLLKDPVWIAPLLWRSEFRSVLIQYQRRNQLSSNDILELMNQAELRLQGNEFSVNSAGVLILANESGCSSYDCEFVSLAQDLNFPLITQDKQILQAFPKISHSIKNYLNR